MRVGIERRSHIFSAEKIDESGEKRILGASQDLERFVLKMRKVYCSCKEREIFLASARKIFVTKPTEGTSERSESCPSVGIEPKVPIFKERSDYKNGASRPQGEAIPTEERREIVTCDHTRLAELARRN